MTLIDEKTHITPTDTGDHDRFKHYFPKAAIDANLMNGTPMKALCGKVVTQQVDPKGRTLCGECERIYQDVLQPGDDEA